MPSGSVEPSPVVLSLLMAPTASSPLRANCLYSPVGGGVNEVVDMNISIAPSTPITFSDT